MKYLFIVSLSVLGLVACSESTESKEGEVVSKIAADGNDDAELQQSLKEIEAEEKEIAASTTTMRFDKTTIDFGKIKEDSENNASFIVTNTGKSPLIIEKVDVSCGCTTAKKPEKPIAPGKSDKIEIVFHPKVGQLDDQNKTVTISANTDPVIEVLNIKAFVTKK
jgi:hypothetical protein